MKLNNIRNRKEFLKINELVGASQGGVGSSDGFANNLSLKDTYLGILLDGMFKSISWLWRKSKENFVINKLLARLTNELLRGVILYCFANNINIGSGEAQEQKEEPQGEEGEPKEEPQGEEGEPKEEPVEGEEGEPQGETEPVEEPGKVKKVNPIETGGGFIAALNKFKTDETISKLKQNLETGIKRNDAEVVKKYLVNLFMTIDSDEVKQRILSNMSEEQRNNLLSYLPEEERKKYHFGDQVQDVQAVQVKDEEDTPKSLPSGVKKALPAYHDEFQSIRNDIKVDLQNPTPETIKNVFGVSFDPNKVANIKNVEQYENIINNMYTYLKNNIDKYDKLKNVAQKEKIKNLYMNYIISKNMLNKFKQKQSTNESLNEDFVTAKPMSDPRAGADPKAKKISTNVTVGEILTKRDREKYKEHADEIKLNLSDLNLAEIEKAIEKKGDQDKVSTFVNPENLKTIQLTADNLFAPNRPSLYKKAEVGDKSVEKEKLNIKWNKELSKVYANFSNLMNISTVDIRKDYRKDLDSKLDAKVDRSTKNMNHSKNTMIISDSLKKSKIIEDKYVKFSDLKGRFGYLSFTAKDISYIGIIADVREFTQDSKDQSYLIRICNTFENLDIENNIYESNFEKFKDEFKYSSVNDSDIYFMLHNPNISSRNNRMVVLNYNSNANKLYLTRLKNDTAISINLDDPTLDLENEKIQKYILPIRIDELRLLNDNINYLTDEIKVKFNINNVSYYDKSPKFYNKLKNILIKIKDNFQKQKV